MGNITPTTRQPARHGSRRHDLRGAMVVGAVALLLAGCGQEHASASAASVATRHAAAAAGPTAAKSANEAKLLAAAQRAYVQHKVVAPAGDNAIEYYLAVLDQDPGNEVAKNALREVFPYGVPHVQASIAGGGFDEANREIGILAKADPGNYTLDLLRTQLAAREGRARGGQGFAAVSADVAGGHLLIVHATADSWVEVTDVDSGKVESGVLRAGESRTYHSAGRVSVTLGNATGVTLIADGRPIDVERFRRGKVAHLMAFVDGAHGEGLNSVAQLSSGLTAM